MCFSSQARSSGVFSGPNRWTAAWWRPARIPFSPRNPGPPILCRELGLGDQLIGSNDAERKTYILLKNKLVPLPDGLMFMVPTKILPVVFSSLFSLSTKLRMAFEWFTKPRNRQDESVAAMVERHYGAEMVERWRTLCFPGFTAARPRNSGCARCCRALLKWKRNMEA